MLEKLNKATELRQQSTVFASLNFNNLGYFTLSNYIDFTLTFKK
jgi:hypothetical protein